MSRIVVLGAGESGTGAAVLAKKEGFDVFVSDMSAIKDKYKKMLDDHGIEAAFGGQDSECRRDNKESRHTQRGSDGEKSRGEGHRNNK